MYKKKLGNIVLKKNIKLKTLNKIISILFAIIIVTLSIYVFTSDDLIKQSQIVINGLFIVLIVSVVYPLYVFTTNKNYNLEVFEYGFAISRQTSVTEILYEEIVAIEYIKRNGGNIQTHKFNQAYYVRVITEDKAPVLLKIKNNEELIDTLLLEYNKHFSKIRDGITTNNIISSNLYFGRSVYLINGMLAVKDPEKIKLNSDKPQISKLLKSIHLRRISDYHLTDTDLIINFIEDEQNETINIKKNLIFNLDILQKAMDVSISKK